MAEVNESFLERGRRKRREQGLNWTVEDERAWLADHPDDVPMIDVPDDTEWADDLVPDIGESEQSAESREIDQFLSNIDIVKAYDKWSGKGTVHNPGNKREGVKVRCPNPAHPDHDPSAWLNLDKDVYVCGGCGMEGGDQYVIAAYHFGIPVPIPRSQFPELKKKMANDLGYQVKEIGRKQYVEPMEVEEPEPEPEQPKTFAFPNQSTSRPVEDSNDDEDQNNSPLAEVVGIKENEEPPSFDDLLPELPWQSVVNEDSTFLKYWMKEAADEFSADSYIFWLGMMALGMGVKDKLVLRDRNPVKGNMFLCLVGESGVGKTRSTLKLETLIRSAMPDGPGGFGVRWMQQPLSGAALVDLFFEIEEHVDPADPKKRHIDHIQVAGIVPFDEMAELIKISSWSGSDLREKLQSLFDASRNISASSRSANAGSKVPIEAYKPYGSVITTTQFESIKKMLNWDDNTSGFINRWLFVGAESKRPPVLSDEIFSCPESIKALRKVSARVNHVRVNSKTGPALVTMSDEAFALLDKYDDEHLFPIKKENVILGRGQLFVKKFALLLAIDRNQTTIDPRCIQDAYTLWKYIEAMFLIIGEDIGIGRFDDCKRHVIKVIEEQKSKYNKPPQPNKLVNLVHKRYKFPSDLIYKVLQGMVRSNEITAKEYKGKNDQIVVRYDVVS